MLDSLQPKLASRIIHSLAESGQPPKVGASYLNVGTDHLIRRLRTDYLEDLLLPFEGQDGGGTCKWVVANYGNGKTQFLRCIQEEAWKLNYVTAFVELSQDECPLARPDRVYGSIARSIHATPLELADIDRARGIEVVFQSLVDRKFDGVLSRNPNDALREQAIDWVKTSLGATPTESTGFRRAVVEHLLAKLVGDVHKAALTTTFLRGEPCSKSELHQIGVYETLDKSTGFRFLRSLCQLLQRADLATGTVLLFDEARRSLSLMSSKSQKIACENLLSVINRCNSGDLPGTLFLYAVMPEFFTEFATAYPALQQRCGPGTRINLESLQVKESDLLEQIGAKITDVFRTAHAGAPVDNEIVTENLRCVAAQVLRCTMVGSGTRRLMVATWVRALQRILAEGVHLLSAEDASHLIRCASEELEAEMERDVGAEGE
jgi:hypothetical protein